MKTDLISQVIQAIMHFQDATDLFDTAAADSLQINRTDLRCLGILHAQGPLMAGEVARQLRLTKGATTTALNRLVDSSYIKRKDNPEDGRSFQIELTSTAKREIEGIWKPLNQQTTQLLKRRSTEELKTLIDFLHEGTDLQKKQVAQISLTK